MVYCVYLLVLGARQVVFGGNIMVFLTNTTVFGANMVVFGGKYGNLRAKNVVWGK